MTDRVALSALVHRYAAAVDDGEIDAVIDPADTRAWLARGLASARVGTLGPRFVDTW